MSTILELNTGLFPDAETVADAIATRDAQDAVVRVDVRDAQLGDAEQWDAAAAAILDADLIVTL